MRVLQITLGFTLLILGAAFVGQSSAPRAGPVMWIRPPDRPGPRNAWPDLAIRDGQWKLLVHRDGSRPQLFDLSTDPNEKTDRSADQPALVERLSKQVIEWDRSIR